MGVNLGQGSLGYTPGKQAATPATVTGANNGTSLSGANVQLGQAAGAAGNPAALLNNREIPLSGFSLNLLGNTIDLLIDDALQLLKISDAALNPQLFIDFLGQRTVLGDLNNYINPVIDLNGNSSGNPYIDLYAQDLAGNNIDLFLDAAAYSLDFNISGPISNTEFFIDQENLFFKINADNLLLADKANQQYSFGDPTNGPRLFMRSAADSQITIDMPIGGSNNAKVFRAFAAGKTNPIITIGDIDVRDNGIVLLLDDNSKEFQFDNFTHDAKIRINTVVGFTGTVSPVNSITVNGGIVTAVS